LFPSLSQIIPDVVSHDVPPKLSIQNAPHGIRPRWSHGRAWTSIAGLLLIFSTLPVLRAGTVMIVGGSSLHACDGSVSNPLEAAVSPHASGGKHRLGKSLGLDDLVRMDAAYVTGAAANTADLWPESPGDAASPSRKSSDTRPVALQTRATGSDAARWLGVIGSLLLLLGKSRHR
jgi:hypothetical protein